MRTKFEQVLSKSNVQRVTTSRLRTYEALKNRWHLHLVYRSLLNDTHLMKFFLQLLLEHCKTLALILKSYGAVKVMAEKIYQVGVVS